MWALNILVQEGFTYDSSIFPIYHDTYGIPDAQRFPHTIETDAGPLVEFPLTTVSLNLGWKTIHLPIAGGGGSPASSGRLDPFGDCLDKYRRTATGRGVLSPLGDRSGSAAHTSRHEIPFQTLSESSRDREKADVPVWEFIVRPDESGVFTTRCSLCIDPGMLRMQPPS